MIILKFSLNPYTTSCNLVLSGNISNKIPKVQNQLKYHQVASELRDRIMSEKLSGQLDSERELCSHYEVSRVTIRKAIELLESEHLVYRVGRKGLFAGRGEAAPAEKLHNRRIGFILFGNKYMSRFENIVFTEFSRHCTKHQIRLIFSRAESTRDFSEDFPAFMQTEQPDLLILCGSPTPAAAALASKYNISSILLGRMTSPEPEEQYDRVAISYYQWAYRATRYLITKGRHRIAMICPKDNILQTELTEGYRAALEEENIVFRQNLISVSPGDSAMTAMNQTLSMLEFNRPEAIIAGSDAISAGVVPVALQTLDEEIGVVAFSSGAELNAGIYPVEYLRVDSADAAVKLWNLTKRRLNHPSADPKSSRPIQVFE